MTLSGALLGKCNYMNMQALDFLATFRHFL